MLIRDLAKLPASEKKKTLAKMVDQSRGLANGHLDGLESQIAAFEAKYDMTTAQMLEALGAGEIPDEFDFIKWRMLVRAVRETNTFAKAITGLELLTDG